MSVAASAGRGLAGATVLQLVPSLGDNRIGRDALALALGLLRAGARALIAGESGPLVGELQAAGGEWLEFAFGARHLFGRRRAAQALQALLASEHVDLAFAHGADLARYAQSGPRAARVPLVIAFHEMPMGRAAKTRRDPLLEADVVLTLSEFAADLLARNHGVLPDRIGVIPQSVDLASFDPAAVGPDRLLALRQAWRIGASERIILAPGRVSRGSGHLALADATRILLNGGLRDIAVIVADDGDDAEALDRLKARIAAQGVGAVVRCPERCGDMPAAYAAADLVALTPERPSAFDARAPEALAMGRPVVASAVGALPELVPAPPRVAEEARTGWLVRSRDPIELARVLAAALAAEPDEWRRLAHNGRRLAVRKFSTARVSDATLAVCGALLEGGSEIAHRR